MKVKKKKMKKKNFNFFIFIVICLRYISVDSPILHKYVSGYLTKWLLLKIIEAFSTQLTSKLIIKCMKNQSIRQRTDYLSSRIIILGDTHLHICDGEGLGNLLVCLLTMWYKNKKVENFLLHFLLFHFHFYQKSAVVEYSAQYI